MLVCSLVVRPCGWLSVLIAVVNGIFGQKWCTWGKWQLMVSGVGFVPLPVSKPLRVIEKVLIVWPWASQTPVTPKCELRDSEPCVKGTHPNLSFDSWDTRGRLGFGETPLIGDDDSMIVALVPDGTLCGG